MTIEKPIHPRMEKGIYNPRDIWKKPYFVFIGNNLFKNIECSLEESDYEKLCKNYKINPLYPPFAPIS